MSQYSYVKPAAEATSFTCTSVTNPSFLDAILSGFGMKDVVCFGLDWILSLMGPVIASLAIGSFITRANFEKNGVNTKSVPKKLGIFA